jgi:lysophospholipase L1-like esterase
VEIGRLMRARPGAIAVIALMLAGCGPSVPPLSKLDNGATVLAFGDSLTHGTGATPEDAYPAQLGRLIGRRVVAAGVPGEVSEEGLRRLPAVLDDVRPQLLIVCHGGNDFLRRLDEHTVARNVREMVALAKQRGIAVMLVATPKPGFGAAKVAFYEQIGRELGIPVEHDVVADVLTTNKLKSDLVHPNAEGYRHIAEAVAKVLRKAGAI